MPRGISRPIQPLEERVARYDLIVELRSQTPPVHYEDIGQMFEPPLTKERVRQIHLRGRPRPPGRPRKEEAAR